MRIGFIGLGNMGGPMALNLMKAGHALVVHDVRPDAAKPHLDGGAKWAESPKALARASELILTSLPGPKEVEAVALGPDGIIHGAVPGTVYADLSTGSPTVMRKLHAAFKDKGVHVLDAPVSDRKSTRLNSSHLVISYAVFCLKKKKKKRTTSKSKKYSRTQQIEKKQSIKYNMIISSATSIQVEISVIRCDRGWGCSTVSMIT